MDPPNCPGEQEESPQMRTALIGPLSWRQVVEFRGLPQEAGEQGGTQGEC